MNTFRSFIKKLTHPFLKKGLQYYYRKPRPYSYKGIAITVHPEVFPPQLTLSTKILLDFISKIDLQHKTFLELGCGSGIISLFASKNGAQVTASDINLTALTYLKKASKKNNLPVKTVWSNLFKDILNLPFNYIIINPPYYPKNPLTIKEQAWFCGENFEYFIALFNQLPAYLSKENKTYMILSEDCKLTHINTLATQKSIQMKLVLRIKKIGETNFIFKLSQA